MIKLHYVNNVTRILVAEINKTNLDETSDITEQLINIYQSNGFSMVNNPNKFRLKSDEKMIPLSSCGNLPDNTNIWYIDIIKPDNAYEYDRKNGIIYFFNTSENPHKNYPHIHAKYGDDKISIYFKDLRIEGKFKSPKKQKEAKCYVKTHIDELYEEWNKIIEK